MTLKNFEYPISQGKQLINPGFVNNDIATHYCAILDIFIYITRLDEKVKSYNIYKDFDVRSELLESKQFFNKIVVNYNALKDLKKELKK